VATAATSITEWVSGLQSARSEWRRKRNRGQRIETYKHSLSRGGKGECVDKLKHSLEWMDTRTITQLRRFTNDKSHFGFSLKSLTNSQDNGMVLSAASTKRNRCGLSSADSSSSSYSYPSISWHFEHTKVSTPNWFSTKTWAAVHPRTQQNRSAHNNIKTLKNLNWQASGPVS